MKKKKYIKWIVLSIFLVLTLFNFYYSDVNSNIRQGMNVWESLFSGRFFEYYSLNAESKDAGQMIHLANYGMLLNVFYGIWQLPLFIIEKIIGGNILDYFWARVWGKSIHLIALYTAGIILKKIAKEINISDEKAEILPFLFVSATPAILSALNASQMDGIGLNFMLLALYFLIKDDYKKFLIFLVIAVQFKDFASIFFLPVILYKEKNIFKIMGSVALPFAVSILIKLPFSICDPAGVGLQKSRMWNFFDQLTRSRVNLVGGIEIPLVFLVMGLICMFAYYKRSDNADKEKKSEWYLYFLVAAIAAVVTCVYAYSYWIIYIVPFYLLLILKKEKNLFVAIVLESFAQMSVMVAFLVEAWGVFDSMDGMLVDKILAGRPLILADMFSEYLKNPQYYGFWTLSFAAFIVWLILVLVSYYPDRKNVSEGFGESKTDFWYTGTDKSLEMLYCLRAVGGIVICNIMPMINLLYCIK